MTVGGQDMRKKVLSRNAAQGSQLGWPRTIATGLAFLFVALAIWTGWANYRDPTGGDFISFWSAGQLTLQGHASAAYDISVHRAVERTIVAKVGLIPFPYPPPFLMIVTPFAIAPFGIAFILWDAITAALYAAAARRITPLAFAMANPPIIVDFLSGQTGLLISAIFIAGLAFLPSAPLAAGAMLGLLIIKPQLALLLPFAMLAGRQWRVIAGALVSSATLLLIGLALFGIDSYRAFFELAPHYVQYMQQNRWDWREFASVFAFARYCGLPQGAALAVQLIIAALTAALTSVAWARRWEEKIPILAAGSLLISGYLLTYDALLLIVPAAYFVARRRWEIVAVLWLLCALPVVHFFEIYDGPNTIPVAAVLCLALLTAPHMRSAAGVNTKKELRVEAKG
jgi:glycosyl transferase family 87